ncbi:7687_t:CDS:2 [Acaulospora morrowiae]|uniref:7687_t:CDS:1 n=1 Tax=Acaulospora morrowiae TaxID=94023 RepID=A0A9N9B5C9_9GLOM|nr:7687_t:CDS:2 [Acaulospora morrowiae]
MKSALCFPILTTLICLVCAFWMLYTTIVKFTYLRMTCLMLIVSTLVLCAINFLRHVYSEFTASYYCFFYELLSAMHITIICCGLLITGQKLYPPSPLKSPETVNKEIEESQENGDVDIELMDISKHTNGATSTSGPVKNSRSNCLLNLSTPFIHPTLTTMPNSKSVNNSGQIRFSQNRRNPLFSITILLIIILNAIYVTISILIFKNLNGKVPGNMDATGDDNETEKVLFNNYLTLNVYVIQGSMALVTNTCAFFYTFTPVISLRFRKRRQIRENVSFLKRKMRANNRNGFIKENNKIPSTATDDVIPENITRDFHDITQNYHNSLFTTNSHINPHNNAVGTWYLSLIGLLLVVHISFYTTLYLWEMPLINSIECILRLMVALVYGMPPPRSALRFFMIHCQKENIISTDTLKDECEKDFMNTERDVRPKKNFKRDENDIRDDHDNEVHEINGENSSRDNPLSSSSRWDEIMFR